jgi:hypothetical protein
MCLAASGCGDSLDKLAKRRQPCVILEILINASLLSTRINEDKYLFST